MPRRHATAGVYAGGGDGVSVHRRATVPGVHVRLLREQLSLQGRRRAQDWAGIGWGEWTDSSDPVHPVARAVYPANQALAVCVAVGTFLGVALAALGLGLQAQRRAAPGGALGLAGFAVVFWAVHLVFFVQKLHSTVFSVLASALLLVSAAGLAALAVGAWREMRRHPPPRGHEVLPADYKVPYSHFHADPPEVRLAREMDERRQRLFVQQKELEALEERIRRHKNDA